MVNRRNRWLQSIIGLGLLVILAAGLVVVFRHVPAQVQTRQAKATPVEVAQAPTKDLPMQVETIDPTPTPFPTFTPWPTPTRRPESTMTPMVIKSPAKTATGYLLYTLPDPDNKFFSFWMSVNLDETGQKVKGSERRWSDLDSLLTYAQPSPTGKYVLFVQPTDSGGIPYIYELQTKQTKPLFGNEKLYAEYKIDRFDQLLGLPFGWHPDGQRVLFWVGIGGYAGLWLVNIESGERTVVKLTGDAPPQGSTVSPDGQRVAYAINDNGAAHLEIAYTDGSLAKTVPDLNITTLFDWSPDGKWLLFWGNPSNADSSQGPLWFINPDTFELYPLQIPLVSGRPFKARWSPDSRYIAAVGATHGEQFRCTEKNLPTSEADTCEYQGTSIYIQDITTDKMSVLASGISPAWSPDGSMLAFLSNRSGNPEIWTIHTDGTELQQITTDGQWKWSNLSWVSLEGEPK